MRRLGTAAAIAGRDTPSRRYSVRWKAPGGRCSAPSISRSRSTARTGAAGGEERQPPRSSATTKQWIYRGLALALVILFLTSVARFYHPGTGFTALIAFGEGLTQAPAMRDVPHEIAPPWASYDGQFYAQRALDPLCRDPRVDRAIDLPAFRARRILFSWTAYAAGLGRPVWIIQVYALQNVVCWLLLAWLLTRWIPPASGRGLALWTACLFSHGALWSVRFALLDLPEPAADRLRGSCRRGPPSACFGRDRRHRRSRARDESSGRCGAAPAERSAWMDPAGCSRGPRGIPLLIWEDYLRSIYRSAVTAGAAPDIVMPGTCWRRAGCRHSRNCESRESSQGRGFHSASYRR